MVSAGQAEAAQSAKEYRYDLRIMDSSKTMTILDLVFLEHYRHICPRKCME